MTREAIFPAADDNHASQLLHLPFPLKFVSRFAVMRTIYTFHNISIDKHWFLTPKGRHSYGIELLQSRPGIDTPPAINLLHMNPLHEDHF